MRIAILTNDYPPLSGGAGRIASVQAEWFARQGHEIQVWTAAPYFCHVERSRVGRDEVETSGSKHTNKPDPSTPSDGVYPEQSRRAQDDKVLVQINTFTPRTSFSYRDLGKHNAISRLLFHFEDLAPNLDAVDKIRIWQPDVLITHNVTGCGWGTAKLLKASGMRWIHVLHDVQMFEPSGQRIYGESFYAFRRMWRNWWAERRRRVFGAPDAVISPTRWLLEQHRAYGLFNSVPSHIIPNPVDIQNLDCNSHAPHVIPVKTGIQEISEYDLSDGSPELSSALPGLRQRSLPRCPSGPEDDRRVLYVGRLSYDKGVDVLLEAWRSQSPRLGRLTMIGDGPMRQVMEDFKDPSVDCLGQMEHSSVMELMSKTDLVVSSSRVMENQPTVLLEAVALGKKVVATDVGGVRESLSGYGTIVKPGDAQALAEGINQALNSSPQPQLREQILESHKPDKVLDEFVAILSTIRS